MKPIITFLFVLSFVLNHSIYSQNLLKSKGESTYTYICKINNLEAKTVYKKDFELKNQNLFYHLIDSFPSNEKYSKKLPQGHYLKIQAVKNKQFTSITSVQNFNIYLINNNRDLNVLVKDLKGNTIKNALVQIEHKKIKFNKETQLFTHRKSNKNGLLEVTVNGFTAYYQLSRLYNNSSFKRITNKVIYGSPLKYIWIPVDFTLHLPKDTYRSIKYRYPQGGISRISNFFRNTYNKIACLFDSYYCDDRNDIKGYLVFSKPKYKPRDTVKFKAFLTNKKGKPIHKTMDVTLYNGEKTIKLTQLKPYRKGGYSYSFFLHDSLQLKLDNNYYIHLEHKDIEYYSKSFHYEDYELKGNKLEITIKNKKQYKGDSNSIIVKATDINDLPIQDGRLEVLVSTDFVSKYFDNQLFIPDTLHFIKTKLNDKKETEIKINDSLFPAVNMSYKVQVRLLTSDNETKSKTISSSYIYKSKYLHIDQKKDSLVFEYFENNKSKKKKVLVKTYDNFGNTNTLYEETTPFTKVINPYYAEYSIESDSLIYTFQVKNKSANIQCFTERDADSIKIKIDNPTNIPFFYNVYKGNKRIKEGYSKDLTFYEKANKRKGYYLFLNYIWAGQTFEDSYEIPYRDKDLQIKVLEPKLILPGQKVKIEVKVTDAKGKPVKDVDITAYSLNNKFNYTPPQLPSFNRRQKAPDLINSFTLATTEFKKQTLLNYAYWNKRVSLDSIAYYQFIYPGEKMYRYETQTKDKNTQFAPFVFNKGNPVPIHVISVDYIPIYFSWTEKQAYSFPISAGKHHVRIRTANKTYMLDSIEFNKGKKLVFSIDSEQFKTESLVYKTKNTLSKHYKNQYKRLLVPYRTTEENWDNLTYIYQNNRFQLLKTKSYKNHKVVGPFIGDISYNNYNNYELNFKHEKGFEYDFSKNLLKMRSVDLDQYFPRTLSQRGEMKSIFDVALTKEAIDEMWQIKQLNTRKYSLRYNNPSTTKKGKGKLVLKLKKENNPLNILLISATDSIVSRIYPGTNRVIHNLTPSDYHVILLNQDQSFSMSEAIHIKGNGYNYLDISAIKSIKADKYIKNINSYLSKFYQKPIFTVDENDLNKEKNSINRELKQKFRSFGNPSLVTGIVSDESGPLPGVSVLIEGTSIGTETDFDGFYSIMVYPGDALQFSYIGMESQLLNIEETNNYDIKLKVNEENVLDEVVVTAMGINRQKKTLGYTTTIVANSLEGKVSGVQIQSGTENLITIRGVNSLQTMNNPLVIINGMIYFGEIDKLSAEMIKNISILKGDEATALYGNKAVNGVIIINTSEKKFTKTGSLLQKKSKQNSKNSIRSNFNDEAFWQPTLTTDKEGKAVFQVTFPDDITTWSTHYLAMNSKRQTGSFSSKINSYKELMAELFVPRFLVKGDTVRVIGKTRSSTNESFQIKSLYKINNMIVSEKNRNLKNIFIDTLKLVAKKDSLHLIYQVEKDNTLADGEKRSIPVYKKGLNKTKGAFIVLDKDTVFTLNFDKRLGDVNLYAKTNILEVLEDEIKHINVYKYNCNEQLASKLKALLNQKKIVQYKGFKFKDNRKIKKTIRLLNKYQKPNGYWGWWKNSTVNEYISLHVLEALIEAEKAGYKSIDKEHYIEFLLLRYNETQLFSTKVKILKLVNKLGASINYKNKIDKLSQNKKLSLIEKLSFIELKQTLQLPYKLDFLESHKKTTLFGNYYYTEKETQNNLWNNDIQVTLLAYKVLRNQAAKSPKALFKIRQYFLEKRKNSYWQNTYESIKVVETILPDILKGSKDKKVTQLIFKGSIQDSIVKFPYHRTFTADESLTLSKQGNAPIYFTYYQKYWDTNPKEKKGVFEVKTYFKNNNSTLISGKTTKLITELIIKKDAEYVMLTIPIPASCTYDKKDSFSFHETHREYFKNETSVFYEKLPKGKYTITLDLIPKYTGTFTVNPAKIELMYFPTFNANNKIKTIRVE